MPSLLSEKRADGIGLVTFNQPERMNAFSTEMNFALRAVLADFSMDPAVRCVMITGTGKAFCAGADLKRLNNTQTETLKKGDPMETFHEEVRAIRIGQEASPLLLHTMPKPTVGVINGYCIGVGFSLALGCDIRLAGTEAKLSTGYRNLALAGDYGGTYFLSKLVGDGIARELLFTGEMMDADRARSLGIVNRVYPQPELQERALEFCRGLAEGPTLGMALAKENLSAFASLGMKDALDFEARNMILGMKSQDHYEAVRAFAEKRSPVFKGR